jgi:hypothetical protein
MKLICYFSRICSVDLTFVFLLLTFLLLLLLHHRISLMCHMINNVRFKDLLELCVRFSLAEILLISDFKIISRFCSHNSDTFIVYHFWELKLHVSRHSCLHTVFGSDAIHIITEYSVSVEFFQFRFEVSLNFGSLLSKLVCHILFD